MATTTQDVIASLNVMLKNELTAINQYFLHSRMLRHQGYLTFAEHEYNESIEEMKHADTIMQRIFLLGGLPNLQDLGRLHVGETPIEILKCDYALEKQVLTDLKDAHHVASDAHDPISVNLIEDILAAEETHLEQLDAALAQVKSLGEENYLQTLI